MGDKLVLMIGGKEIESTSSATLNTENWDISKEEVMPLDMDSLFMSLTGSKKTVAKFEYYMKRKGSYYFRNPKGRLIVDSRGLPNLFKEYGKVLKYGERYTFSYTLSD